jgi:hypothetical protein
MITLELTSFQRFSIEELFKIYHFKTDPIPKDLLTEYYSEVYLKERSLFLCFLKIFFHENCNYLQFIINELTTNLNVFSNLFESMFDFSIICKICNFFMII